jgi:hypothetical protein
MKAISLIFLFFCCSLGAQERYNFKIDDESSSGIIRAYGNNTPFIYMVKLHQDFHSSLVRMDVRDKSTMTLGSGFVVSRTTFRVNSSGLAVHKDKTNSIFYTPPTKQQKVLIFDGKKQAGNPITLHLNEKGMIVWSTSVTTDNPEQTIYTVYEYKVPYDRTERNEDLAAVKIRYQEVRTRSTNSITEVNLLENGSLVAIKEILVEPLTNERKRVVGILDKDNNFREVDEVSYELMVSNVFRENFVYSDYFSNDIRMFKNGSLYSAPENFDYIQAVERATRQQVSRSGMVVITLRDKSTTFRKKLMLWNGEDVVAVIDAASGSLNERGDLAYVTEEGSLYIRTIEGNVEPINPGLPDGYWPLTPMITNDLKVFIPNYNYATPDIEEMIDSLNIVVSIPKK